MAVGNALEDSEELSLRETGIVSACGMLAAAGFAIAVLASEEGCNSINPMLQDAILNSADRPSVLGQACMCLIV